MFQALCARQEELRGKKKSGCDTGRWLKSLSALASRLRWRSHFAQKLSDQPSIEHENMCRAYDVLRTQHDQAKLDAWTNGLTGFPMVMCTAAPPASLPICSGDIVSPIAPG